MATDTSRPYPPLLSHAQIRTLEQSLANALPPYTLMMRAGAATAQLALAKAPHARHIWIACGAGNNGGDGLEAAIHLVAAGKTVHISLLPSESKAPPADASRALGRLQQAGLTPVQHTPAPGSYDLAIDALWGIGLHNDLRLDNQSLAAKWLRQLYHGNTDVLSIDIPSGLLADTGSLLPEIAAMTPQAPSGSRWTLTMLGAKPGLFTHQGKEWAGEIWLAPLSQNSTAIRIGSQLPFPSADDTPPAQAEIGGELLTHARTKAPSQNTHKGQFGDVGVIGGEAWSTRGMGMEGAAILAANAALHSGAGRVMLHLLGTSADSSRPCGVAPDIMLRNLEPMLSMNGALVCGCGGGSLVANVLPHVLSHSGSLVLDADALNSIAEDEALQRTLKQRGNQHHVCVLTPHPLELARLLGMSTVQIQADRIGAAQDAAQRLHSIVVLKGSGTVIAAPNGRYAINQSGNARLAIGGTGDVLAGCIGAQLAPLGAQASTTDAWQQVLNAVWLHGHTADRWPPGEALTASRLAQALQRLPDALTTPASHKHKV